YEVTRWTGVQTCAFFFQAEDGIRDFHVTGVQTCALPIWGQPLQEGARLRVLHPLRTLREVAARHDDVRRERLRSPEQRCTHPGQVRRAEMQVRDVEQLEHRAS